MKILLDENIDVRFKAAFPANHEVFTVKDMSWAGVKNGQLLQLIGQHDFDCWIVVDKNIPYQQNIDKLPCLVIVLNVFKNTLPHLQALLPRLLETLKNGFSGHLTIIDEK